MSHLETTPTGRSYPSRSFIPSPPGAARRLTFGSSKKEGYGIVSASGFDAWKRGLKRRSTSTKANTTTTTISNKNTVNRGGEQNKKGLGMGLEGTPAKKRFKRDSGKSKPSMGNQSTPKGSISRKFNPNDPSTTMSMTISSFTASPSPTDSPIDGDSPVPPVEYSFAVGAETIIGEDVFGLTISIEADGTFRARSPSPALSTASSIPWVTKPMSSHERIMDRWFKSRRSGVSFDAANDDAVAEQEEEEEWYWGGLISCAETEVPVNFGDSDSGMEEVQDDDTTLRAIPQEIIDEAWSDLYDATRVWDITVPIRDTSVLVYGWRDLDATDFAQIDHVCAASFEQDPRSENIEPGGLLEGVSLDTRDGGLSRARGRKGESRIAGVDDNDGRSDDNAIEASRDLKLSRLGMYDPDLPADSFVAYETVGVNVDAQLSIDASPKCLKPTGPVDALSAPELGGGVNTIRKSKADLQSMMDESADDHTSWGDEKDEIRNSPIIEEIDHISRVRLPPGYLDQDEHRSSRSVSDSTSDATATSLDDPTGFKAAAMYIKRERPRWYRATSSPTPPPPGRDLSTITFSPTPTPSVSSVKPSEHDQVVHMPEGQPCWAGAWKGRGRQKRIKKEVPGDIGIDSRSGDEGRGQYVDKVFIEPAYYGKAKAARDARIAHYKDLENNYKLHVEEVYL